ncbi:MAG: DUF748 domain-containing protein [Breznakibacter sp.]
MRLITKKRFYIPATFLMALILVLYFASDITRHYIQKNSKEMVGRVIQLNELHFNYYNVSVRAKGFKIFEDDNTTIFGGFRELLVDFQPWNLLHGEYAFSQILIDSAYVFVLKKEEGFNFDSLVPQDTVPAKDTLETTSNLKFLIENIQLLNGKVDFYDATVDNRIVLDNLSLTLPQIAWNNQESKAGVNFMLGEQGTVHLGAEVNRSQKEYNVDVQTRNIDINFSKNYLTPYIKINEIGGLLDLNLRITGSSENYGEIVVRGSAKLNGLLMTDSANVEFLKAKHLEVVLDSLDLKSFHFNVDTLRLVEPYLYTELMPKTTNLERILQPVLSSMETESDTTIESQEEDIHYKINHLQIEGGEIMYNDKTLNRPFQYRFQDIVLTMEGLSDESQEVSTSYSINLNDMGMLKGNTRFNMLDPYQINHQAKISRLQLQSFSPYSEYFLAHSITAGHFNYDFSIEMSRPRLANKNSVKIQNLKFGTKTRDTTATKLPVRFALYLLKDKDDKIEFELPVTGNPSDPEFKLGRIIWKTVANFLIKTATTPFNALASLAGGDPNRLKSMDFELMQDSIMIHQKEILDKIIQIHQKKPELLFTFEQFTDPALEREMIAVAEAKKMMVASLPTNDSMVVELDEPVWIDWINGRQPDLSLSLETRCMNLVGASKIAGIFSQKMTHRNESLKNYLEQNGMTPTAFRIQIADLNNMASEMKKPHFKIDVELP